MLRCTAVIYAPEQGLSAGLESPLFVHACIASHPGLRDSTGERALAPSATKSALFFQEHRRLCRQLRYARGTGGVHGWFQILLIAFPPSTCFLFRSADPLIAFLCAVWVQIGAWKIPSRRCGGLQRGRSSSGANVNEARTLASPLNAYTARPKPFRAVPFSGSPLWLGHWFGFPEVVCTVFSPRRFFSDLVGYAGAMS